MKERARLKSVLPKTVVAIICAGFTPSVGAGTVVTYPAPEGVQRAADFVVQVDGEDVFVYENPVAPFAYFSFSGRVTVTVTVTPNVSYPEELYQVVYYPRVPIKGEPRKPQKIRPKPHRVPIETLDIRPKRRGLKAKVNGGKISFELTSPANLSIEINRNLTRPLFLFANPLESAPPEPGDKGVRYFASGKVYDVGQMRLNDNETIYIAGGAVVRGTVLAENVSNARILGRGILDGSDPEETEAWGRMIDTRYSKDVLVEGITILNDRGWTVVPRESEDIQFLNMKMIGWSNNSDGIDVVGCRRVKISKCFLRTDDDSIVIKSRPSRTSGREARSSNVEHVEVLSTVLWDAEGGNALEIGFELQTDLIRDILFKDVDIIHVEQGAAMSIHNGDWATVSNVRYEDIWVEDSAYELIDIQIAKSIYSPDAPLKYARGNPNRETIPMDPTAETYPGDNLYQFFQVVPEEEPVRSRNRGRVDHVYFKNIYFLGEGQLRSQLSGYNPEHLVRDVTIENLWLGNKQVLSAEEGNFKMRFAENVRFLPGERKNPALAHRAQ